MKSILRLFIIYIIVRIIIKVLISNKIENFEVNEDAYQKVSGAVSQNVEELQSQGKDVYYKGKKVANKEDIKNAMKYAYKTLCLENGFTFEQYGPETTDYRCRHTKETCNNLSTLHKKGDAGNNFLEHLEWRPDTQNCVLGIKGYVDMCNTQGLTYDKDLGKCKPNKKYCKCRGLKWKPKTEDCQYYPGQKETSFMFGKTMTQGVAVPPSCL